MAEYLTKDVALALLGNALATGAMLMVLITIFGPISGAHFNLAASLIFALKRDLLNAPKKSRALKQETWLRRQPSLRPAAETQSLTPYTSRI